MAEARSARGLNHRYVANEVLIATDDPAELQAFLKRVGGTVVGDDSVPPPPPGSGIKPRDVDTAPHQYTVRVDTSGVSLADLDTHAARAGLSGEVTFSDDGAARLLALVAREKANGLRVSPNFLFESSLITSSQEHPAGAGFANPFTEVPFATTGSRSNMVLLWQFVAAQPPPRRSSVAIIDGGFWLDATGRPFTSRTDGTWASDFPEAPVQYDFVADDYLADGPNLDACTGGSPCPWHGNGAAGVAVGRFDNQYGGAGTGGQVADPMLFKTDSDWGKTARSIRTAVSWGADVISMSFGANCDNVFCDAFFETNLYPALRNARDNGVVMVAAAGNEAESANGKVPCKAAEDVICVGALENGTLLAKGYSNSGTSVDLWAPTDVLTLPDGDTTPNRTSFGGTSASAPFVAGVAAVMRAYDSTLTSAEVTNILRATAWTDSTDPKVTHALNAYRALREVTPGLNAPPHVTVVRQGSTSLVVDLNRGFNVRAQARDLEDGDPCCTVTWSPAPTATSDSGRNAVFTLTTVGSRTLTATVTDRGGATSTASLTVTVRNSSPVATIQQPLPGASIPAGAPRQLLGSATDFNEPGEVLACSRLRWTSSNAADASFPVTGCDVRVTFATTGARTLTLTATDPQGFTGRATVSVNVTPAPINYGPTISFGALPAKTYEDGYSSSVNFNLSASATDPEGNTPITYRWKATSYRPNTTTRYAGPVYITSATTASANLSWKPDNTPSLFGGFSVFGNACYNGQNVLLELEATDSLGNKSIRAQTVKVYLCQLF
ncbi:S8 family peptidase [Pyxidicoccus xibeiensis]|uniref:S8 family peptidase n=1 Tax=Pyxidicoccus xibeiensis TaxID=2906759 RepID=UPI0020A7C88C|nr:S8 family serine peptidase [Pyxidicoccus xibeiensis]MCP3142413.1 S8 family serine peptidase [Pyxidicoccus xibeiensis]